ncbi:MAG: dihydroneopterin aldolase [Bacteroidales bacterium]|nr:dihydroneopterin aldolase [Bacteroidales bacterium]
MQTTDYIIQLKGVHLYAHHGVLEQEKAIGAWFTIDLELQIADHACLESDEIEGTVSYADVYAIVRREMNIPSKLLENVCYRISSALYNEFIQIASINITLTKDTPPMGGDRLGAAVTIKSKR